MPEEDERAFFIDGTNVFSRVVRASMNENIPHLS
jgi:hypothetical protein